MTDRNRAEQALRASEERYRALHADIPSMYFTGHPAGTVLSGNAFGASHLGYTEDELVGGSVLPPDQQVDGIAHLAESATQRPFTKRSPLTPYQFCNNRCRTSRSWASSGLCSCNALLRATRSRTGPLANTLVPTGRLKDRP